MQAESAEPVEAFDEPQSGGSYAEKGAIAAILKSQEGTFSYGEGFCVHGVFFRGFGRLEREESPYSYMEREGVGLNAFPGKAFPHFWGEVKVCGGGGYGSGFLGVEGLVAGFVFRFGGAVEVGWQRHFAKGFQHLEGGEVCRRPFCPEKSLPVICGTLPRKMQGERRSDPKKRTALSPEAPRTKKPLPPLGRSLIPSPLYNFRKKHFAFALSEPSRYYPAVVEKK
uniref:Uncharacterized protein n=1 Tax=uncultured Bacteroidota bacterium TaxID=152509 RepID=H5SMT7_9BACT|nr:hypothetical protein HGMM_F50F04C36 [uncultured Bacteroidetes bacterium]